MKPVNTQESDFPRMSDPEFLSKGLIIFFLFLFFYACCTFYHPTAKGLQKGGDRGWIKRKKEEQYGDY